MNDIIARLKDKDDKVACEYAKQIGTESAGSDKYLGMIPEFAGMLTDKSSYVRTRGFGLICNQARWADAGQIEAVFDEMSVLLYDDKPTVVRQCLAALHEVALYRPEMTDKICIVQCFNHEHTPTSKRHLLVLFYIVNYSNNQTNSTYTQCEKFHSSTG